MAKKKTAAGPTGVGQISTMKRLSQGAAAWLLGFANNRTLRDKPDAPRNPDGSYDAKALFAWAQSRSPRMAAVDDLGDSDYERLEVAVEIVSCAVEGAETIGLFDSLDELSRKHGAESVATWLFDRLMTDWERESDFERQHLTPVTQADLRKAMERAKADNERAIAIAELRVCTQCDQCKRVRHGRRWLKQDPPGGYVVWMGTCPSCKEKQA